MGFRHPAYVLGQRARSIYPQHPWILPRSSGIIISGRIENDIHIWNREHLGTNHGLVQKPRLLTVLFVASPKSIQHWWRSKLPLLFRYISTQPRFAHKPSKSATQASCPVLSVPIVLFVSLYLGALWCSTCSDCRVTLWREARARDSVSWTSGRGAGRGRMGRTSSN